MISIELIILSLPETLRSFVVNASLNNYHYDTKRIFLESENDLIIERLLYAVNWDIFRSYMLTHYGVGSTRQEITDTFIALYNPTLVETIILINEMYGETDRATYLRQLVEVQKTVSSRIAPKEIIMDDVPYDFEEYDDNHHDKVTTKLEYYGYEPDYESAMDEADRLYGIPDPRLVED